MTRTPPNLRRRLTGGARGPQGGDLKARAALEQDTPISCDLRACLARPAHGKLALAMHGIAAHNKLQGQEGIPTRGAHLRAQ